MIGAGLLAKKAVARGLTVASHVKTSLAPGSRVVSDYLDKAGLTDDLKALGFHTVGYGCTTCIGNSGPLPPPVAEAIREGDLIASAVLSGNRNFEGRVNPLTKKRRSFQKIADELHTNGFRARTGGKITAKQVQLICAG